MGEKNDSAVADSAQMVDRAERAFFTDLQRLLAAPRIPFQSGNVSKICAVDAAYKDGSVVAVATEFTDGVFASEGLYQGRWTFPYVSGIFYLHEGPAAVEAVRRLKIPPDLVCFDAHGAAHPRGMGMATIAGMVLGVPSIGIAKSRLIGRGAARDASDQMLSTRGGMVGDLVSGSGHSSRYWSPGYSVKMRDLRILIMRYGPICLKAMAISDRRAREEAGYL